MMNRNPKSKSLSRRGFLCGVGGAALSLPYLESMEVAAAVNQSAAKGPLQRMAFFYLPNGLVRQGLIPGEAERAIPKFTGFREKVVYADGAIPVGAHKLALTPTMTPLKKIEDKVTLITGLDRTFQQGTDSHAQAASCYLTSCAPYTIPNSVYPIAKTLDHIVAEKIGQGAPFPTLELSCNSHKDNVESIYFDNMSWYGPSHVAPSMRNPRLVYDRLFSTDANSRYRDITDLVLGSAKSLKHKLGQSDQRKFEEYFEAIRSIEKRMDRLDAMKAEVARFKGAPPEEHLPRNEYIYIMGDLQITALQAGLTQVSTMMIAPERWNTPFKYEGILDQPRSHHSMSHNPGKYVNELLKLDRFHVSAYGRMVEKMAAIEEEDGTSLLDNTIFTLGAGLGDGTTHQYNDLPVIVAGGGGGKLKHGQHIQCKQQTPLANLWLTYLQTLGIESKQYADSSGIVSEILKS